MGRLRLATMVGALLTTVLVGPGRGEAGDDAGGPVPTAEEELRQHADALLEETVCPECRGLGLLLKRDWYFSRVVLGEPWCVRPDRLCVEPLAQLMVEEDPRQFPEAEVCPECYGLGFRFTPHTLGLYDDLRREMYRHGAGLPSDAREELRRQVYLFNLARGYFRTIEEFTQPRLDEMESVLRYRLRCANFYEYRLVLADVFANLVRCFPPGAPTLERDRQARELASEWERPNPVRRLIEQVGGVRIPGANLSFAEWAGLPRPQWDLLEAVHRQEMEQGTGAGRDPDLEQAVLEEARLLEERVLCTGCGGSGVISVRQPPPVRRRELRSGLSEEMQFPKLQRGRALTVRSRRVPCEGCGGLGWQTGAPLDDLYRGFSERLQEARPDISPSVYEEAWLLGRQFQLKAFLCDRMQAAQAAGEKGASLRRASRVEHFQRASRILTHCFDYRARGPEADRLAQYRKTQFDRHAWVDPICRALEPAVIPDSWLTLEDWAANRPPGADREEEASRPPPTTPKGSPIAPLPEVPRHPLEQLEE